MKSALLKPIYSTTLIATLLTSATPVLAATTEVATATAPVDIAELTLDQAVEKAMSNNIDLELLKLDFSNTDYNTRLTLSDARAIKLDSIYSLDDAESKYEDEAGARRDYLVSQASMKAQENTVRLEVQKVFFEVQAARQKMELQKRYINLQNWAETSGKDAKDTLDELKDEYRDALARLNGLMNENMDKEWKLVANDLVAVPILSLDEVQKTAFEKRPDMVKVTAEKTFAKAKVTYIQYYASLSTYPGRIAQNDLKKAELLWQLAQKNVEKEIGDVYEKLNTAKQALEESKVNKQSAEEEHQAAYRSYLNGELTRSELVKKEKEWLDSTNKSVESTYQYNVAVATLQYSTGF